MSRIFVDQLDIAATDHAGPHNNTGDPNLGAAKRTGNEQHGDVRANVSTRMQRITDESDAEHGALVDRLSHVTMLSAPAQWSSIQLLWISFRLGQGGRLRRRLFDVVRTCKRR